MGFFVQTTLYGKLNLKKIVETGQLRGNVDRALAHQPPTFKDVPMSFSSYVCDGYPDTCGNREGVVFVPVQKPIYACPVDTINLIRNGEFLPGHERFLFNSVEKMLERYPDRDTFKEDFRNYFSTLNPRDMYDSLDKRRAELYFEMDYCFNRKWNSGCNEVAFPKPLDVSEVFIFESPDELKDLKNIGRLASLCA